MSDPNLTTQRQIQSLQDGHERLRKTDVPGVSGTWTPTLVGATIAGTFTYNAVTDGTWTRLGNVVFFGGRIAITAVAVAPTGNLSINGLPIAAATVTSNAPGGATFTYWSVCNLGGGANVSLGGWIQNAATIINLTVAQNGGGAGAFLTGAVAAVAAGTELRFHGQYQV